MAKRTASATWKGGLREGIGSMRFGSGAFEGAYSFTSRFEEGDGTNPEELIAAAHAGCFSMALSAGLEKAGFAPTSVETTANLTFKKMDAGWRITAVNLVTIAEVPDIHDNLFMEQAEAAKEGCPISNALHPDIEISVDATLK